MSNDPLSALDSNMSRSEENWCWNNASSNAKVFYHVHIRNLLQRHISILICKCGYNPLPFLLGLVFSFRKNFSLSTFNLCPYKIGKVFHEGKFQILRQWNFWRNIFLGQSRYQPHLRIWEGSHSFRKSLWNMVLSALGLCQISRRNWGGHQWHLRLATHDRNT